MFAFAIGVILMLVSWIGSNLSSIINYYGPVIFLIGAIFTIAGGSKMSRAEGSEH